MESQQYVLKDLVGNYRSLCNITYWAGQTDGVLYRKQFFDYRTDVETHFMQAVFLADYPVANGLIRVDKLKLFRRPVTLTLGSYGFPDHGTEILQYHRENASALVLKGRDATGRERQMAMTIYDGWKELGCIASTGTNPDSEHSMVLCASADLMTQYDGTEPYIFISQVLTKESWEPFGENKLFPIKKVIYADEKQCGTYGPVKLVMEDGENVIVDYNGIEGRLSI